MTCQPQQARLPPPWFAEAVVLLRATTPLREVLSTQVRVERGRMGRFETTDFGLVLLLHAVSGHRRVCETYAALFEPPPQDPAAPRVLRPEMALLPALWGRQQLPSRSALSRWLACVSPDAVNTLRRAFARDLADRGLPLALLGGCLDRTGGRHVLFDVDGTGQTARQRAVVDDGLRPRPKRRRPLMAKGHTGRRRGEVVRTRVVVVQAHTQERLGTFGHAGNTDLLPDLRQATSTMTDYLQAHALTVAQGLCRLDGLYGHAVHIAELEAKGLGWLVRCADYRLLAHPQLLAALAQQTPRRFVSAETGLVRDVYDIGFLSWTSAKGKGVTVWTRIILTLRDPLPTETHQLRIGKRFRGRVAELFATDRAQEAFLSTDVLSLYLGRGGFEGSLAHEDQLSDPDRFVSHHGCGQELFQIICQWVDNVRLRLSPVEPTLRTTLWADAVDEASGLPVAVEAVAAAVPQPSDVDLPMPLAAEEAAASTMVPGAWGRVAPARGRGAGRFGGSDFVWQPDGTLRCPAGQTLRRTEQNDKRGCHIYTAPRTVCTACAQRSQCVGGGSQGRRRGRSVSVFPAPVETPAPAPVETTPVTAPAPPIEAPVVRAAGPQAVYWQDVAAISWQRALRLALHSQRVEVQRVERTATPAPGWQTRDQRAHRRQTWAQRQLQNAQPPHIQWYGHLHGVPPRIAAVLAGPDPPPVEARQQREATA